MIGGELGPQFPSFVMQREARIAELATRQHGVVARRQLFEHGLTPRMIDRRLESGSPAGPPSWRLRPRPPAPVAARTLAGGGPRVRADGGPQPRQRRGALGADPRRGRVPSTSLRSGRGRSGHAGIFMHEGRPRGDRKEAWSTRSPSPPCPARCSTSPRPSTGRRSDAPSRRPIDSGCSRCGRWKRSVRRSRGRRGLRALAPLIAAAREPTTTASPLEDRVLRFAARSMVCRSAGHQRPAPRS